MNNSQFKILARKVDKLNREIVKAEASIELSMKTLKERFDVDTVEEAEELLKKKEREVKTLEKKLQKKMDAFESTWSEHLDER